MALGVPDVSADIYAIRILLSELVGSVFCRFILQVCNWVAFHDSV